MANQQVSLQAAKIFKFLIIACLAILGISCGGGSSSSSNGGVTPAPAPIAQEQQVNISNISAIPSTGNQTTTSLVTTNNTTLNLVLTKAVISYGSQTADLNLSGENNTFGGSVNVAQCGTLQANGTCGVGITPPNSATGSYLITLSFAANDGSKTFTASQVVTYAKDIPSSTGFTYSNLNNNVYAPTGGSSYMVIPFIVDHDTTTLYAYSSSPGAMSPSLVCPGGTTYKRGDLCSVLIRVGNLGTTKSLIATITVSDDPNPHPILSSAAKQDVQKMKAVTGSTGYSFSTPVSVTTNSVGNLITSAFNPVISPANGSTPVTITLLNNGVATLSGITLTVAPGSPVTITNTGVGSCATGVGGANSLTAGSSCTYQVNANTTTSGQSTAYVTYNNGGSSVTLAYAIVYISAAPGPGMSLTAAQGSLQNALVGTTSTLTINVQNTGTTALTNITFTPQTSFPLASITYDTTNSTCSTGGAQVLAAGAKCTLIVKYLPLVAQSTASFNISGIATYTDQGGTSQTYSGAYLTVQYSAFLSNAFVYLVPNYTSYAIRADNADTTLPQTITLVNSGGQNTTLANPAFTTTNFPGSGVTVNSTACNGFTLTAGGAATCDIIITYGPVAAVQASISGKLNISYAPGGGLPNVTAFATEVFQAQAVAVVSVQSVVKSGATGGTGTGTGGTPYTFFNSPYTGAPIIFTITYQNTGAAPASLFSVNVSNLPVGYVISGVPTCGYGATTSTLAATNGTCTIALTAMGASTSWNPYIYTGSALNLNIPGYSYNDANTGVNINAVPSAPTFGTSVLVTANLFSTLSGTGGVRTVGAAFNATFTSTAGDSAEYGGAGLTITIPPTSLTTSNLNSVYLTTGNTCQITTVTGSCNINITTNANAVGGGTVYTYAYWVTPQGLTPSVTNSMVKYFSFTLN